MAEESLGKIHNSTLNIRHDVPFLKLTATTFESRPSQKAPQKAKQDRVPTINFQVARLAELLKKNGPRGPTPLAYRIRQLTTRMRKVGKTWKFVRKWRDMGPLHILMWPYKWVAWGYM